MVNSTQIIESRKFSFASLLAALGRILAWAEVIPSVILAIFLHFGSEKINFYVILMMKLSEKNSLRL